jgi:hypothetical protein
MDYRYDKTLFYEWLADRRTPTKELGRLAKDLGMPGAIAALRRAGDKSRQKSNAEATGKNS